MREKIERMALQHVLSRLPAPVLNAIARGPVVRHGRTLDPLLAAMMTLNAGPSLEQLPPPAARRTYGRLIATTAPDRLPMATVADAWVKVEGGSIRVRRHVPAQARVPGPAVMFFHGGGMVVGNIDQYDSTVCYVAEHTGCAVFSVDYRCGPEHRFPTGVEDAIAAWSWLHAGADHLGIDCKRVAVMGDSAGGYLSAAVAQAARDRDLPSPALQCLVYPVLDMRLLSPSVRTLGQGFGLTEALIRWFCDNYVRNDADRSDPLCSPLLADTLAGLPPAIVTVAGLDPLHDEGVAYAERMRSAGVPVTLLEHDHLTHAWFTMAGLVPPARAAMDETCHRVREALCT